MRTRGAWIHTRNVFIKRSKRTAEKAPKAFHFQTFQELCDHIREANSKMKENGPKNEPSELNHEKKHHSDFGVFKESGEIGQIKIPFNKNSNLRLSK